MNDKEFQKMMSELEQIDDDDFDKFHGVNLNIPKWGLYQDIVEKLSKLSQLSNHVEDVKYSQEPIPFETFATVMLKLSVAAYFSGEEKDILDFVIKSSDSFALSALEDKKICISFVVNDIWNDWVPDD